MIAGSTLSFNFIADDADVCGVDEAGRGPLAGPVVAAAVVLDRRNPIEGLRDSKLLTIGEGTSEILRVVIGRHELGGFVGN